MTRGFTLIAVFATTVAVTAGCTTQSSEPPALTGPSGFSTSASATPVANFQILPNPIDLSRRPDGGTVTFDASSSCGVPLSSSGTCSSPVTSSQFAFSDGTTASGPVVVRHFSDDAIGTLSVLLVVTNSSGAAASATRTAQVLRSAPPKADFTFTPPPPLSGPGSVTVFFADTSTVVAPRVIQSESWDFLDGRPPTTGATVPHVFSVDGTSTFLVVLTVTDDLGQTSTASKPVTITVTPPVTTTPAKAAAVVR